LSKIISTHNPPTLEKIYSYRQQIQDLADQYGAYHIRIFGSVVRKNANPDSDIDFLVDFQPHSLLDRIRLSSELSELLGHPVDIVQEKNLHPHILIEILKEAISL
jgi:predicted nucleotidyltransferase